MVTEKQKLAQVIESANAGKDSTFFPPMKSVTNVRLNGRWLTTGLYILTGGTAGGKSTNALALALDLCGPTNAPNYMCVLEPRAYGEVNDRLQRALTVFETVEKELVRYSSSPFKYLVIDSVTYIIPAIGSWQLGDQDDVTMKEGLRRSEVLGVLTLDSMARKNGLTLIATINAELFPRPAVLEGACEGAISLVPGKPGQIQVRDRSSRKLDYVTLNATSLDAARHLLGQSSDYKSATQDNAI